jgi:hypothetical protein
MQVGTAYILVWWMGTHNKLDVLVGACS